MTAETKRYDIIVVGGGNAGLCAAVTAAETGARVAILESAPKTYRGRQFPAYPQFPLHA